MAIMNVYKKIREIVLERRFIIFVFLFYQVIRDLFAFTSVQENMNYRILRITSFILYTFLAFLSMRKNKIATIILGIIIIISGFGICILGFFVGSEQFNFKVISIIFGAFLIIGGIRLILKKSSV